MRIWLLILLAPFILTGCQTIFKDKQKQNIVYISKPKLNLEDVAEPVLSDKFKFLDKNGLICTDAESLKEIANNNLELIRYAQELKFNLEAMKKYYEDPIVSKTVE